MAGRGQNDDAVHWQRLSRLPQDSKVYKWWSSLDWNYLPENLELHTRRSAEAEYYFMVVEETIKAKGVQTVAQEIGLLLNSNIPIGLFTDSSAAKSFESRRGLDRMRHVATRELWLQEEVLSRRLVVHMVHGEVNPPDFLTKYFGHQTISKQLKALSISVS